MHSKAQNLGAECSNCLSLVVWFHGDTSRKSRIAPENFSKLTKKPYHNVFVESKDAAHLESRHKEEYCANHYRIARPSDP